MILLYFKVQKKTYSQERADRRAAELAIFEAKKEQLMPDNRTSLCCKAKVITIYQPKAMENEVKTIRVCTACNSEAPILEMFNDWSKVQQFFVDIHAHKTNNNLK